MTAQPLSATSVAPPTGVEIAHPAEWPVYDPVVIDAVAGLVREGRTFDYDYGEELARLESAFARRHGRAYALALTSGTAALYTAYHALGIAPGDQVVVSDYTFFSTATPLLLLGAVPVLADAADERGNVDVDSLAECITPRTVALAVTHLWGHPCPLASVERLARAYGLALLEDCSHAHGATYRGRPVGSFGDVSIFSIGGRKLVSGGLGGVLLTDDEELYARACLLANFRHRTDLTIGAESAAPFLATGVGGNFRISPIAALLAESHLSRLDDLIRERVAAANALADGLAATGVVERVPVEAGCTVGAWYDGVVSVTPDAPWPRDELVRRLRAEGTKLREPATRPLHRYPVFTGAAPQWSPLAARAARTAARANDRAFPVADALFERWLRLPINFLWDGGSIVEPYVDAFARVVAAA